MAVELKAGLVCDQWLEELLALDERQTRGVPPADVQEIEGIIDEMHAALAVGRRLGLSKAWQAGRVDAAELAVDVGGLHVHVREGRIFVSPVEPGPGQELRAAIVDAGD